MQVVSEVGSWPSRRLCVRFMCVAGPTVHGGEQMRMWGGTGCGRQ